MEESKKSIEEQSSKILKEDINTMLIRRRII